jgi:hypothetical protein
MPYPYQNRSSYGNSAKFRTGKTCIDCDQPAGTLWSPLWCVECNIKRIDRIDAQFTRLARDAGVRRFAD